MGTEDDSICACSSFQTFPIFTLDHCTYGIQLRDCHVNSSNHNDSVFDDTSNFQLLLQIVFILATGLSDSLSGFVSREALTCGQSLLSLTLKLYRFIISTNSSIAATLSILRCCLYHLTAYFEYFQENNHRRVISDDHAWLLRDIQALVHVGNIMPIEVSFEDKNTVSRLFALTEVLGMNYLSNRGKSPAYILDDLADLQSIHINISDESKVSKSEKHQLCISDNFTTVVSENSRYDSGDLIASLEFLDKVIQPTRLSFSDSASLNSESSSVVRVNSDSKIPFRIKNTALGRQSDTSSLTANDRSINDAKSEINKDNDKNLSKSTLVNATVKVVPKVTPLPPPSSRSQYRNHKILPVMSPDK